MCRFQRGFWSLAFLIAALGAGGVYAMDLSHPFPARSAVEVLHPGPSSGFFKEYDAGVQGQCGPLLSHLDKTLQDPDSDVKYSAQLVYGEMYDRAVCVDYSPVKSFEYFKQAAQSGGSNFYAIVGWKYYYGHGVEQSKSKANDAFKLLLIRNAFAEKAHTLAFYHTLLRDRAMPDSLKKGVNWLIKKTETDKGLIDLALTLIDGSGTYFDGSPLPIDKTAAQYILSQIAMKNPRASYILGNELLKGHLDETGTMGGRMYLERAGICGYEQAVVDLIDHILHQRYGFRNTGFMAYAWYLYGQDKGYEGIQKYADQFKTPSYTMSAHGPSFRENLEKREKRCQLN